MPNTYNDPSGLSRYGWTGTFDRTFTEHYAADLTPARNSRVDRGLCTAITTSGPPDPLLTPCTGDWAAPRHSVIVRSSTSRSSYGQALAANVDTAVMALSLDAAKPERQLAPAWASGAQPMIALTKADPAHGPEAEALAPGVDILLTTVDTGHNIDVPAATPHGTTEMLGPSGAGKSTLGDTYRVKDQRP
ncbi:GTPase RsgA [Actinomadura spongiicola]|uniref:GTPase RsgA n=1 Tax=Actinomadura spongiicola TaxID=2303421 RepID=A0A372GQV0_9ACTN|nr:GTPase RsgA [Actinomadura spongiicola]RFS87502.1 GTPase RsgA [Actinomadura spongiicola]